MSTEPVRRWGRKPSGRIRAAAARLLGRPTIFAEDGFLRSVRTGADGDPALSIVLDRQGIYYDATAPSDLETLIESGAGAEPALLDRAAAGIVALRRHRLSKYNAAPWREPSELGIPATGEAVLVVDQTAGDLSLRYGQAPPDTFAAMLEQARRAHPDATVVVKTHPAVSAGHRRGHFAALEPAPGLVVLREAVNPWALLERCRTVYVATSQLGFEALVAGSEVHVFGVPFYAGWGLTQDRQRAPRRRRRAAVEEVFACAYLLYSHYRDPYALRPATFEETVAHLVRLRDHALAQEPGTLLVGIDRWKRRWARALFRPARGAPPRFASPPLPPAQIAAAPRIVGWASRVDDSLPADCARRGVPFFWMEDGFLRSVGLGSALVPGASYTLDRQRPYYDARGPSDLEDMLQAGGFDTAVLERARHLRERLVALRLSKYNTGRSEDVRARLGLAPHRRVVLVAGQVEDDMAIVKGAPATRRNADLLAAARGRHPDAFILFKPHPDVVAGLRRGHLPGDFVRRHADVEIAEVGASDAIDAADHVEVITSLIGFEALVRGRSVTCHGLPFYAGWGLTADLVPCPRRTRRLTLDELVAGALVLYPHYVDPERYLPCTPEHLLDRLAARRAGPAKGGRAPEAAFVLAAAALTRGWRRLTG